MEINYKFEILMWLVSIVGGIVHTIALFVYLMAEISVFGLSEFAENWKILGESFGIFFSILLAIGIWRKYATLIFLYAFGMALYMVAHIILELPYLRFLDLGVTFDDMKFALIPGFITVALISINILLGIIYLIKILVERYCSNSKIQVGKPEDLEMADVVQGSIYNPMAEESGNGHLNPNFEP